MSRVTLRTWHTPTGEERSAWIADIQLPHKHNDRCLEGCIKKRDRSIQTFATKREATDYLHSTMVKVRKGTHVPANRSLTVAEAGKNWIKRVAANGMRDKGPAEEATLYQYRKHCELHILPRIGTAKLASMTKPDVVSFRDDLLKSMSRPTARKVLTSFKSILKSAGFAHIAADVSIGIDKRHERPIEAGVDFPTPAEVDRLITGAKDGKWYALLLTAVLTGLRASELRGLPWRYVDFDARKLHVRQRADRFCKIGSPKSAMSRRTMPMPMELVAGLRGWKLACPNGDLDLVFPTRAGQVEQHKSILESLAPVFTDVGVVDNEGKPKYALHAFRHFFAAWCLSPVDRGGRGKSLKEVQVLLGHETIQVTADIYGHLLPDNDDFAELDASAGRLLRRSCDRNATKILEMPVGRVVER